MSPRIVEWFLLFKHWGIFVIYSLCGVEDGHSLPFQRQEKAVTKWWHSQEHEDKKWSQLINSSSSSSIWRMPLISSFISQCIIVPIIQYLHINKLTALNRQINLDWLNLSLTSFKLKIKDLYLTNRWRFIDEMTNW